MSIDFLDRESKGTLGLDPTQPPVLEVALVWRELVLDVQHFPASTQAVTLGRDADLGLPVDFLPDPTWTLVELREGTAFLRFHGSWGGHVERDGVRRGLTALRLEREAEPLDSDIWELELGDAAKIWIELGEVRIQLRWTPAAKRVVAPMEQLDTPFMGTLALMAFLGVMLTIVISTAPPMLDAETYAVPDRFAEVFLQKPPAEKARVTAPKTSPDAGQDTKAKKKEGKRGDKDAKKKNGKTQLASKQRDKDVAENSGVLGVMRDAGAFDGMFSSHGLGDSITRNLGNLASAKGSGFGTGLGDRGDGLGGGGDTYGIGDGFTKGRGTGHDGYGSEGGDFGPRREGGGIADIGGGGIVIGGLDKAVIDAVIKNHLNQIRYCYQRELIKDHSLGGKVVVKFAIGKTGEVSSAMTKSSTVGSPAVESCINKRFYNFRFPEPQGGGIVVVSYPFMFAPG